MARFAPATLRRYLLGGQIPAGGCLRNLRANRQIPQIDYVRRLRGVQCLHTVTESVDPKLGAAVPFRKQLKDEAKKRKAEDGGKKLKQENQSLEKWELTVGIEIHAQLNTARKLFSPAVSTIDQEPNTHVALFDVAMPGSMPVFQQATLIPALRAALALNCDIQKTSKFDRKHYFHWDQPAGYQITQYYEPFAKDGFITLYAHDGIAKEDGDEVRIGIKQIQMEQDTAKSTSQPGEVHLLDFNRAGIPLIEIITLPQIHYPSTAAAFVRKVQTLLHAVDACVLGLQSGGLRADVNVSVRKRDGGEDIHEYAGVTGLGQRTEIKNLSSFKAVEDAIIAERDRQISVLESGGQIEGETRGWTIGSTETRRLRGKEGEVDYRYMPDPDIPPVIIGEQVIEYLKSTLGVLPDEEVQNLVNTYGLTTKDAMSMVSLDNGARVEYFLNVVDDYLNQTSSGTRADLTHSTSTQALQDAGRLCGNWVLHEIGGLKHIDAPEENPLQITSEGISPIIKHSDVASLVHYLATSKITGKTAKKVLARLFSDGMTVSLGGIKADPIPNPNTVETLETETRRIIDGEGWWFTPLSEEDYEAFAKYVVEENEKVVQEILAGKTQKIKFLLGQMMRLDGEGKVDPQKATEVLKKVVGIP